MISFKLEISRDATTYYEVDLFPRQQLEYSVDFYDSLDVDKIKIPFSTDLKIPLTDLNKSATRFNYDPLTDASSLFPIDDFYFKTTIFGSSTIEIEGILNVTSIEYLSSEPYIDVEMKDFVTKYITELKDATLAEVYDADTTSWGTYFRTNHEMSTFFDNTDPDYQGGTLNTQPSDSPIIFPYVDFVNDVKGRFNYAARQFTEYGVGMDRAGIVPVFSVKNFLTALGNYLTDNGFNVRVDSSLFGLNYTAAISDMQPERLQMLIPSKLQAEQNVNTREFTLVQGDEWCNINENLNSETDIDGNAKDFRTPYYGSSETFGNIGSYTIDPEDSDNYIPDTSNDKYGLNVTNYYFPEVNESNGFERGYFAPHMSFNGQVQWDGGSSFVNVSQIKLDIPVLGEDNYVYQLQTTAPLSTMTFGIYVTLYENGVPMKDLRIEDSSGTPIELTLADATTEQGNSNKSNTSADADFVKNHPTFGDGFVYLDTAPFFDCRDRLVWDLNALGLNNFYLPSDGLDISVNGESRYGIQYGVRPIEGGIVALTHTAITADVINQYWEVTNVNSFSYDVQDIRKAMTSSVDADNMNIEIKATENFQPYFDDDEYNLKTSLENTATANPYQVLLAICKRFNCGIFYEYDSVNSKNVLRVDPLHLLRNGSENINQYIDDLKSVKVYLGGDKIQNITISNRDYDLYYDDLNKDNVTIGSTTQPFNNDGISDLKIELESSIYYNSVAGESLEFFDNENLEDGIVSERELALTPNLFTTYQNIGLRFCYVREPIYRTFVKIPAITNNVQRPNLRTITQRIYKDWQHHVFNGRLIHFSGQNWNLMAEDEDGNTTEYYDLYTTAEPIKYSGQPTIEFDMVVPTSELSSLDFFFQTLSATRINVSDILIKSAVGEVFDDYAYLTITGILQ